MTVVRPNESATIASHPPIEANLARNGMAASANQFVSQTAMAVLRDGGNAIDAAVAAAAVLMTVEPRNGHLGADSFFLINLAGSNQVVALNGSGAAPAAANRAAYMQRGGIPKTGLWASTVPGTIACWGTALERYGSRPLATLLRAGIDYAREGVPVTPKLARMLNNDAETYRQFSDAARVFVPDGRVPEIGDTLRQPDLARSLERVATNGWQDFYRGKLAEELVAYSRQHDGLFASDDFANHETEAVDPLSIDYRGYTVFEQPPVSQGIIVLLALNILRQFDVPSLEPGSAELMHLQIEALKLAFEDRLRSLGDPRCNDLPLGWLLSDEHARKQAARVDRRQAHPFEWRGNVQPDTTYMCVADAAGNMVSYIHSLYSGSGVVMGETGALMNSRMLGFNLDDSHPNGLAPGKRPIHTLNNYIVQRDGEPILMGGTPGAHWQVQTNLQILCNALDFGMDPAAASAAPRFLIGGQEEFSQDPTVRVESRSGEATLAKLQEFGHPVQAADPWALGGGVQLIGRDPARGIYRGAADIRRPSNSILGM